MIARCFFTFTALASRRGAHAKLKLKEKFAITQNAIAAALLILASCFFFFYSFHSKDDDDKRHTLDDPIYFYSYNLLDIRTSNGNITRDHQNIIFY